MHRTIIAHLPLVFTLAFALGAGAATAIAAEPAAPAPSTTQVARTHRTATGEPIAVPAHPTVIVSTTTIPEGGRTAVHKHPYQRYVYVLAGDLTVSTVPPRGAMPMLRHYKPGDFFAEMRGVWHFGADTGAGPVKLLVIDQVPAGVTSNMVMKP